MKKDIISILDFSEAELNQLLDLAAQLKSERTRGDYNELLRRKTLGMIFEKASTRTRISFEVGMYELGGHALFLNRNDLQLGRGEEVRDTARVLSRYVSAVMIRAYRHETITEIARYASIPVINGLSDLEHPCQICADILTLRERFGSIEDLTVAWVGDGNNVCNSLILSSALTGYTVNVAAPRNYRPSPQILSEASVKGGNVHLFDSAGEAVADADVIYTDTWISMGDEDERAERQREFRGYAVDESLVAASTSDVIVLHCLPAHRGEEISDGVMEGSHSAVWDQAENRLHAQKAMLVMLLGEK